jgi:DNA-binding GntR family transcriptional regulator
VPAAAQPASPLADRLRRDIVEGVYNPRERLVEADLAQRYGVTRSAMRAALLELTLERLIERKHNRGARIRALSAAEAVEIAQVRHRLEGLVAARAAERAADPERASLQAIVQGMRAAAERGDGAAYLAASHSFHSAIRAIAGHEVAGSILERLGNLNFNRHFPLAFSSQRTLAALAEHERIAAAIVAADPAEAERAVHEHLTSLIELLETQVA